MATKVRILNRDSNQLETLVGWTFGRRFPHVVDTFLSIPSKSDWFTVNIIMRRTCLYFVPINLLYHEVVEEEYEPASFVYGVQFLYY